MTNCILERGNQKRLNQIERCWINIYIGCPDHADSLPSEVSQELGFGIVDDLDIDEFPYYCRGEIALASE